MADFTISIRTLINQGFDFGLQDYPIWSENYRQTLNQKLLDHYMDYEIGQETPGLFKFYLNRAMREIMPYYNQRYKTTLYNIDPTAPINMTENTLDEVNATGTSNNLAKGKNLYSDTPQGPLSDIENGKYLSNADFNENTQNNSNTQNNKRNATHTRKGNEASDIGALINSFRDSFINIDMEVIEDEKIQNCFFLLMN